jgi:hypothetical protein
MTRSQEVYGWDKKLSKQPRDLFVLWREFDVGLDGGKAVRDFTSSERGANWYVYS